MARRRTTSLYQFPAEERNAGVTVTGLREERRRAAADERQPEQPPGDPAPGELAVALGLLDARHREPGAPERPEVRGERVHVLVDAELLLLRLVGHVGWSAQGTRPLVQRRDD